MKNIDAYTPKKTFKPQKGDIIFGEEEFIIGRKKKDIIEVGITKEKCIEIEQTTETIVSKGKIFTFPKKNKKDISSIDKSRKNSSWVVEDCKYQPSIKLIHSTLPESYFVRAKKMKDSEIDPNGEIIEFYTFGSYENCIGKEVEIIGKLN